ncbi:MAG: type II and III secretion system protein family protein [Planctomycetota bacterium]|jgi:pilus assembly protein CpaC
MLKHKIRSAFIASAATLGLLATLATPVQANDAAGDSITIFVGRSHQFTAPWDVAGASLTDPSVADVQVLTTRLVVISGTAAGTTDVILWNDDGETHEIRVDVNVDVERLQAELSGLFSSAGGITVSVSDGVTIVDGVLEHPDDAAQLAAYLEAREIPAVNRTRIPGVQQVEAKIRFAEVSRSGLRELGVNLFSSGENFFGGSLIGGATSGGLLGPTGTLGAGAPGIGLLGDITDNGVTMFAGWPKADFNVYINALAENNYVRIMAEPTLVALSGEEANFLAGGEFPIPIVQGSGGGGSSISVEFKEFGIQLGFSPLVMGDGRIRLRIRSEVSDRNDLEGVVIPGSDAVVPAITRRTAETTLELASGQSFAMAGLLNETTSARRSQIPGLGDIPLLGSLFRSVSYQSGETELVVLVTVNLVEPMDDQEFLPLPGETHEAPSDWEFYGQGKLKRATPGRVSNSEAAYVHEMGLTALKGPGAWAYYGQPPARPRPSAPDQPQAEEEPAEEATTESVEAEPSM